MTTYFPKMQIFLSSMLENQTENLTGKQFANHQLEKLLFKRKYIIKQ